MYQQVNQYLEKALPFLIPAVLLLGITVLSGAQVLSDWVKWIFAFISFSSCLRLNLQQMKEAFLRPLPLITAMVLLQVVMPAAAYGAGVLLFMDDILVITGLVLAFSIPTGVITIMWSGIFGGNTGLTVAVVIINTLVSPLLVPSILGIFVGTDVAMDVPGIMLGLLWMVVVPSAAAVLFNRMNEKRARQAGAAAAPFSKIGVLFVILINSAVTAPYFQTMSMRLIFLFFVVFLLACAAYGLGFWSARLFGWTRATAVSLMYNTGMRNTGVGAAIAVTYFPPAAALPVVLAVIFQQFLAASAGRLVGRNNKDADGSGIRLQQPEP
ncbi:bile acid:sodium symporter family protein [Salibacterium halotolerans]|uniref:Predicted Na+-dependent transporter n=1 Tax=Salibacterium halotolerans TaxID=1884432 RepID=A0A1I5W906_9BACI|nr:bile acid:sodium symporter family protein [Salibacterium halotolerans]SFQ16141.1 Predicted Na+-dependent transporter [Salibacterium halotolerans]